MKNLEIFVAICTAVSNLSAKMIPVAGEYDNVSDAKFVLYGGDGYPTNASIGIVFASYEHDTRIGPLVFEGTAGDRQCLFDLICRSNGYQGYHHYYKIEIKDKRNYPEFVRLSIYLDSTPILCDINCDGGWKSSVLNCTSLYSVWAPQAVVLACKPKPEKCKIVKRGFYMKNVCYEDRSNLFAVYKCYNSLQHYVMYQANEFNVFSRMSKRCSNDTWEYQACNSVIPISITKKINVSLNFCWADITPAAADNLTWFTYSHKPWIPEVSKNYTLCNRLCEATSCVDESHCNGFQYGMYCKGIYVPPSAICDRSADCKDGEDETSCSVPVRKPPPLINIPWIIHFYRTTKICVQFSSAMIVELQNRTRCSALTKPIIPFMIPPYDPNFQSTTFGIIRIDYHELEHPPQAVCLNFIDQTNCSDPDRVGLSCKIGGQLSTVSKSAVCLQNPGLCDNGLDSTCISIDMRCRVHKHQLCNGVSDCKDGKDETSRICNTMTITRCHRMYRHVQELRIPMDWLLDGFQDCQNGIDEERIWPTCGAGALTRLSTDKGSCDDVFLCNTHSLDFVPLQDLCQDRNICDHARMCSQTPQAEYIYPNPVTLGMKQPTVHLLYCLAGISRSLSSLKGRCNKDEFNPFPVFGIAQPPYLIAPKNKIDCKNVFGKVYVYLVCLGKCENIGLSIKCPLKVLPQTSCINLPMMPTRSYSTYMRKEHILASNGLTPMWKDKRTGEYFNNVFQCRNNICIDYEKICNLVNDCGDFSDEENCINSFACSSPKSYITSNQKCDGKIDCVDYSDECNEQCKTLIIKSMSLRTLSWVIGGMAVFLNSFKLAKNIKTFVKERYTFRLNDQALTTVIHFGDLLTGLYLFSIAIIDSIVYGDSYCKKQIAWISSAGCAFLGISSTFGSQLSLFSMTWLSLFRAMGMHRVRRITSKNSTAKICTLIIFIAMCSVMIAVTPLLTFAEDVFVNGMTYNPKIKLFSAVVTKQDHVKILKKYFGRIPESLPWWKINRFIDMMFSQQYGSLQRRKIHFYGNDGVCLFKYFVNKGEPQELYVWGNLLLNFVCFIVILVCYIKVLCTSRQSLRNIRKVKRTVRRNSKNNDEFHRHITAIIFTDFLCWVPFVVICTLHYFNIIDATSFYPLSSIVILPINAAINPIIYDKFMSQECGKCLKRFRKSADLHIFRHSRYILELQQFQNLRNETKNAGENTSGGGASQTRQPEHIEMKVFSRNTNLATTSTRSAMRTTSFTNDPRPIYPCKAVDEGSAMQRVAKVNCRRLETIPEVDEENVDD